MQHPTGWTTPGPIDKGSHVCHLYDGYRELKSFGLSFLTEGLERGEAALYVSGRQAVDDWLFEFQASGVDVQRARQSGALTVMSGEEFSQNLRFSSITMARQLWDFMVDRLKDFSAIRIVGDTAWHLAPSLRASLVCHWEASANLLFDDQDVRAVCEYDLRSAPPQMIHAALRTHPQVLIGGQLLDNPFFEAAEILENEPFLNHSAGTTSVQSMLDELQLGESLLRR